MTTIAFHSNQLSLQGTEVALYDYAHFSETLLGHRSVVVYDQNSPHNHPAALQKFASRFTVLGYTQRSQLDDLLTRHGVGMLCTQSRWTATTCPPTTGTATAPATTPRP